MHAANSGSIAIRARRRGSYGIDAPRLLPVLAVLFIANLAQGMIFGKLWPLLGAAVILGCAGLGLHASRRGKFLVWAELLDGLTLRGDEHILDIGCGRGAVLMMAAQRLSTGRACGVDVWRAEDQSGNAIDACERNATAEGVADRVELRTANMTALPFADASFDVVLSSIAIHNLNRPGRDQTIGEAVRVLRPGGRLMIADLLATRQYSARLKKLGLVNVERTSLGWRMWWTGPWLSTHLVTATKPKEKPGLWRIPG